MGYNKKLDLTGQTIGNFTILEELPKKKVRARCNLCGSVKVYYKSVIKLGINKSCGCIKNPDLTGKRFGRLTVIKKLDTAYRQTEWLCKCDCGNFTKVNTHYLKKGLIKSCGCLNKETSKETYKQHLGACQIDGTSVALIKGDKPNKNNINSGVKGVYKTSSGKWYAHLTVAGKSIYLGSYDTIEEAAKARKEGEEKYFQPVLNKFEKKHNKK